MENKINEKNIPRLGIEPQNCKMSWFETWYFSPLDHEISVGKWLIYQYIDIGKSSTKPPKCPNLVLFFCRTPTFQAHLLPMGIS